MGIDPHIIRAWLTARSLARGLPAPIDDRGALRVDTQSDGEIQRWVFAEVNAQLRELGCSLDTPGYLLKLCGSASDLRAALPLAWQLHAPAYFMAGPCTAARQPLPPGYTAALTQNGPVVQVRLTTAAGELVASGFAAETEHAFIYDRIVTDPAHRRRGLGRAMMSLLGQAKQKRTAPELLVVTPDGRALYERLGWRTISPYSTASIPVAHPPG